MATFEYPPPPPPVGELSLTPPPAPQISASTSVPTGTVFGSLNGTLFCAIGKTAQLV